VGGSPRRSHGSMIAQTPRYVGILSFATDSIWLRDRTASDLHQNANAVDEVSFTGRGQKVDSTPPQWDREADDDATLAGGYAGRADCSSFALLCVGG
jgi:hypothetical protein